MRRRAGRVTAKAFGCAAAAVVACGVLTGFVPGEARADSPLTSAVFHTHYSGIPEVLKASATRQVNGAIAGFLMGKAPSHQKAAVINALGWNPRGQDNAERFAKALASRKGITLEKLRYRHFNASRLFVLGYLLAMDDYFKMKPLRAGAAGVLGADARQILARAAGQARGDFTIHFIRALAEGQAVMDKSFCKVFLTVQKVLTRFPPARRKMKPGAVSSVVSYIAGYRSYCRHLRPRYDPQYNQIYDIVSYRSWIVTGTQAGVVVWVPSTGRVHALRREYISYRLLSDGKYLWVGAYARVLRYDGSRFKVYLHRPKARGIKVFAGTGGAVMALQGRDLYRYDPAADRFVPEMVLGVSAYDLIYRRNGERWYVNFMRSLLCEGCAGSTLTIPVRSNTYPGRDPRRFCEDPAGRLWVADFDDGFFYKDDKNSRFVRVPGFRNKGSDVAVDIRKQRTWFLHYTGGLYLKRPGKPLKRFGLGTARYMRRLHLDPNGKLWVASWDGLLSVRLSGDRLVKRSYVVGPPGKKGSSARRGPPAARRGRNGRRLPHPWRKRALPRAFTR